MYSFVYSFDFDSEGDVIINGRVEGTSVSTSAKLRRYEGLEDCLAHLHTALLFGFYQWKRDTDNDS